MYSQEAINVLKNRIGWSVDSGLPITIYPEILLQDSNRKFNLFHGLVSLSNLFYTVDEEKNSEESFNKFLEELRLDCVLSALTNILDKSTSYEDKKSYDSIISNKAVLFEEVIGYTMVIKAFEIYMSSTRSNYIERNSKLSYQNLKIELEGIKNDNGHQVAQGIRRLLSKSIKDAQQVIFPFKPSVNYIDYW